VVVAVHLAVAVVAVGQQSAGQWMHCWAVDRLVLWLYQMACTMACTRGHDSQSAKQCASKIRQVLWRTLVKVTSGWDMLATLLTLAMSD